MQFTSPEADKILYIKWKIDRGSFVRWWWSSFLCTYVPTYPHYCTVLQYRNFLKILSDDFAHALSSGLTSKMPRRRTLLRLTAKETAHVNARSLQSFLWVIVNEFMSSIVCTNAEGRLLESTEERRRITQLIVVANYEMRWTR